MNIESLNVKDFEDFDHHEEVVKCVDPQSGLTAYIAIHDRTLGPALGGCRMWPYPDQDHAIKDALRLSRGMTYKSAISGLPLGGGKAVIVGNPMADKSEALLEAMGRFVNSLGGRYITAEDSGTSVADISVMARQTQYVAGIHDRQLSDGTTVSGDPSPSTAYGVFRGIEASVKFATGADLAGKRIAIQGVGNVGHHLAERLYKAGAELVIADVNKTSIEATLSKVKADVVSVDEILFQEVDVVAPCALGGALTSAVLKGVKAKIIAGAANNQLANHIAGIELFHRGLLYAPDYVINAGGIIDIYYERKGGYDHARVMAHIDGIKDTLGRIFEMSRSEQQPTHVMADRLARERLLGGNISRVA